MNLSNLPHVHVIKYRSKVKRLPLFGHCSQFVWSPSTCLYPNDCFYFNTDQILSPLPEFIFRSRFSYSRFKKGKPHFRHLQSEDSIFTGTTIIMSPSQEESYHSKCLERILSPSPLRTIEELNEEFEFLNLCDEKLDLEEELFRYKGDQLKTKHFRLEDSESPISRISDLRVKKFGDVKGHDDGLSSGQIESFADLALESPLSRSSRKAPRSSLLVSRKPDPVSRGRTLSSIKGPDSLTRIIDATTQTGTDFEDSFGQRTIGTQTSG